MSAGDDLVRLARAREATVDFSTDGPLTFFARDLELLIAERDALRRWAEEAALALNSATVISARWATPGDGLHLANHDRLIHELDVIYPALPGPRFAKDNA